MTFNEPWIVAWSGYGDGGMAPGLKGHGVKEYIVSKNVVKSHAKAFHVYNSTYRAQQNGLYQDLDSDYVSETFFSRTYS